MTAAFWADPRLCWPGSAAEMRDALLWWIGAAPTSADLGRLLNRNADLIAQLDCAGSEAVDDAIRARREELKGESDGN